MQWVTAGGVSSRSQLQSAMNLLHLGLLQEAKRAAGQVLRGLSPSTGAVQLAGAICSALYACREFEAALAACEQLLQLDRNSPVGLIGAAMCRQQLCDWREYDARLEAVAKRIRRDRSIAGGAFYLLQVSDYPGLLRRAALIEAPKPSSVRPPPASRDNRRIRVAYVSADFGRHAMTALITGLIEAHDRRRFEVIGVALNKDDGSAARQRLAKAFDTFLDAHAERDDTIARRMRELQIDIAVDLMGHTAGARPTIFALRPAPIQVNYLGFPGTTGMDALDYMIVDPFIATDEVRRTATERLVILPDCYLCNDCKRMTASEVPSRSECGLPASEFVFCNFSQAQRITPHAFDVWMRILRQVEGSVLWLLAASERAGHNLLAEAERRGVSAHRLIFADRVAHEKHLTRIGLADLFLDTYPYSAHTTASEALWAGCPIVTRAGRSFPSRVCGSLLSTLGLPELVTQDWRDFEALAVRLARDRPLLADARHRVERGRTGSPLFDTTRFCGNLERAYRHMIEIGRTGRMPTEIDLRA